LHEPRRPRITRSSDRSFALEMQHVQRVVLLEESHQSRQMTWVLLISES
jgi:hypothetical protein